MALNIKKCANCSEDLMEHPSVGQWVHRYNMNAKCPNGTGMATLPVGEGDKAFEQAKEGLSKMIKDLAKKSEEEQKAKEQKPDCNQSFDHDHGAKAPCACGHTWEQHVVNHDCPACGTKKCFGKPQQKQQDRGKGDSKQEQEQQQTPPPPPEGLPEWMLKAGSDINDEWRKRIENRDFMLTDEEAALTIYKHTDPDAASKVREADEEAEKNLGMAVLLAFQNRAKLPPTAHKALEQVVQCAKCSKKVHETTAICPVAGAHQWGVIMPAPKPLPEEKQIKLDDLKPEVMQHYPSNKIAAIKLVREKTGLGLKEAKNFVDKVFLDTQGFAKRYARGGNRTLRVIEGDCVHCNSPLVIKDHQVVHAGTEKSECVCKEALAEFGGKHPAAQTLTTDKHGYFWKPDDLRYYRITGSCKHCGSLIYTNATHETFHCDTGNVTCKSGLTHVLLAEEIPF